MHTILGAGGVIANELLKELVQQGKQVRLVGRAPQPVNGAKEIVSVDISDLQRTISAVAGSSTVYLLVGLKYNIKIWSEQWPRIMANAIEACKRANAKLIFFDNVYMYGKVNGLMTEQLPYNPCSKKGEVRAQIATALMNETKKGNLHALIARAADFYGPRAKTSVLNLLVFDKLARGNRASWLLNENVKHSFTFTPDAGVSLAALASRESAFNQVWHLPTAGDPPTGKEFVRMIAQEFGVQPKHNILGRLMLRLGGLFDTTIRELPEMLYQNEFEYIFDSSKFEKAFNIKPTSYAEGIRLTAESYR